MKTRHCPNLGLEYDPSTYHAFPAEQNFCHKVKTPGPVDLQYQAAVCLKENYPHCPIYTGEEKQLGVSNTSPIQRSGRRRGIILALPAVITIAILLAAIVLFATQNSRAFYRISREPTREATITSSLTAVRVVEPVLTATNLFVSFPLIIRQPTPTAMPTLTFTPSPTVTDTPLPSETARSNSRPTQGWYFPQPTQKPARPAKTAMPAPPPFRPTAIP